MKNPLTPAGIEPTTFRFVAQQLHKTIKCFIRVTIWWHWVSKYRNSINRHMTVCQPWTYRSRLTDIHGLHNKLQWREARYVLIFFFKKMWRNNLWIEVLRVSYFIFQRNEFWRPMKCTYKNINRREICSVLISCNLFSTVHTSKPSWSYINKKNNKAMNISVMTFLPIIGSIIQPVEEHKYEIE
jgi:hypothetical protein